MVLQTEVKGGLTVTLVQWAKAQPAWKEYLPELRKTGDKLRTCGD